MIGIGQDASWMANIRALLFQVRGSMKIIIRAKTAVILSFFKYGNKRGYKRGKRICTIKTFKDLPGLDHPRLVWASCKEGGIQQLEVLKM